MIQFNLLPDVKIEFIQTQRRKHLIVLISTIASSICLAFFVVLFLYVRVNQPKHMKDLDKDIKTNVSKIQAIPDLDKILTVQNQLNSLPGLHDKKVVSSRLADYLTKLTPNQATISDASVDFQNNTISLKGNTDTLITVNKFADTLKFTEYKVNADGGATGKAFKDVVLQSFSVSAGANNGNKVSYELSFGFEPAIFAQVKNDTTGGVEPVSLTVPKIVSTRSATETPANLFAPQPEQPKQGGR